MPLIHSLYKLLSSLGGSVDRRDGGAAPPHSPSPGADLGREMIIAPSLSTYVMLQHVQCTSRQHTCSTNLVEGPYNMYMYKYLQNKKKMLR